MAETTSITFRDGAAYLKIPEGYGPGDLVVLHLVGDRVLILAGVLEDLVRAFHVLDEGPTDPENGAPMTEFAACACGWSIVHSDRAWRQGVHGGHVEHAVREALAGRATV
jgi:hypothetical protein